MNRSAKFRDNKGMRLFWPTLLLASSVFADPPGASVQVTVKVPPSFATGTYAGPKMLMVPPGFEVSVWARLDGARFMALSPNGDVFVSQPGNGAVYVYRSVSGGVASQFQYVSGLTGPHGIAFDTVNGVTYVYIAESNQVNRFVYNNGDTVAHDRRVIIKGLPDGNLPEFQGNYAHPLKNLAVSPDHKLYVGIGSSCNVCSGDPSGDPVRGSIYVYNADGSGGRLFARGLRNPEGLAFIPGTNTLWAAVNNRDQLPYPYQDNTNQYDLVVTGYVDDHPPEPFTRIRDGGNYGWPFCNPTQDGPTGFDNMQFDPDLDTNLEGTVSCSTMDPINRGFQAHSAPLQMTFAQNTAFPAIYRNGAVVAFHGSWDRTQWTGYKVVYLPWNNVTNMPGPQVNLVDGFWNIGSRPAGLLITPSGSLLISDDATGTIFELTYTAQVVSGASAYPVVAPDSFAAAYGAFPGGTGLAINMTDSSGSQFPVRFTYAGTSQLNFLVPTGVQQGSAKVAWSMGSTSGDLGTVQVTYPAPGLFSVDGTGTGTAAATASDSAGNAVPVFACQFLRCGPVPIDLTGPAIYLALYGTGIAGSAATSVQAFVNEVMVPVTFAGRQPTYDGLDQVNVQLPGSLAGSGSVQVKLSMNGVISNVVTVVIQ